MNSDFEIRIIATGSKGNAYLIIDGFNKLLIDPGITMKKLIKGLDFDIISLDGCLVSHEHKDHSLSALDLTTLGINCFMSTGTRDRLKISNAFVLYPDIEYKIEDWKVLPFDLDHDSAEPLGFLIESPSQKKILYICDTCSIDYKFAGITHYMIECNYIMELLEKNDSLTEYIKDRIINNHMEFGDVKNFFLNADLSKTEQINLIHLSKDNSNEILMRDTIQSMFGIPTYV